MRKRLLSMAMALCMVFSLLPTVATAASNIITGQGYEYNTNTKTLTVKETGGAQRFGGDYYLSHRDECIKAVIQSGVTALGYCEFHMFAALTTVEFSSTITKVSEGAFNQCTSLTEITIPETVTEIGNSPFWGCTALKKITLPSSLTSITEAMFEGCTSLETITFNNINNVKSIGNSAFKGCINLKSFTIPANVTSIGDDAFYGCSSLGSITIPSKVNTIGSWAFYKCTSLTSAIFQNSMTDLPQSIFQNCGNLSSVTLPSNLKTIGIDAFRSCTSLSSINIPSTVTLIDSRAFQECSKLSAVNFTSPSDLNVINDYSFDGCSSLKFIIIPSKVTRLGYNAFSGCTNITAVLEPLIAPTLDGSGIVFTNAAGHKLYLPKTGTGYDAWGWFSSNGQKIMGNVGLTNLTLSSGELSPAFSFNQYNYTATVPTGTSSITITPTSLRGETITVNGAPVVSGQPSNAISLTGDTTTITIQATYDTTVETYTIAVTKAPAPVDIFTLSGKVTAPVKNITPSTTSIDTSQYTGTVSWKDASGADVGSKFLGGTAYTATVTLTPKKGYTFKGVLANTFTYTNATVIHAAGGDGDLVVSIKFPATAARTLSSIAITAQPKTSYKYGETFSASGMIVKATYDDGTTDNNFTNYTIDKMGTLTPSDTKVTLTAAGTSITATQTIIVAARVLTSIAVTTQPKMTYKYGETFITTGMVVKALYEDGGEDSNFTDYTWDKTGPLTMSDTTVTLTARGTAIKTTLIITINRADGPAAPSLTFSFDGANANKLMGANSTMQYSLDGGVVWSACTNNMTLDVTQISAEKDIKVRIKETDTTKASDIHIIDILPSPAAPSGITATDCTIIANNNGKISGVSTAMEYKLSTVSSWTAVSGNEITGLKDGTYDVRIKATGNTLPGMVTPVTINAYNPATVDKLELDDYVTAPTKNGTPSTTAFETDQYTGVVSWKVTTGAAVGSKFLGGTAYTATVTLTPKYGYTFSGVSANSFTYSDADVTHSAGGDGNLIVSIAFPATAARELVSIVIGTQPAKKSYMVGENFDKTGMVIIATYDDNTTDSNFTDYTIDKTGPLKSTDSSVTVTANSNASISTQQLIEVSKLDGPPAPTVTFSFDGKNANKLMGAATLMQYSLDDGNSWSDCSENMDLTGATITTSGIKVCLKETETTKAGEVQTISISKAATPTATASNATVSGKGTITGVTTEMEYKLSTDSTWTSGNGNPISLDPGTYHVRVKATGTVLASDSKELIIAEFVKGTPTKLDLTYSLTALVYDGNTKPLPVTAVLGMNLGAITVYYNGSAIAPANAGTYGITVDIAGNAEYNAVTGLSLGDYTIEKANHTGNTTASKTVRANKAETNLTVALPTDLPEGANFAAYGTVGGAAALIASHSVTDATLTFSTISHAASSATITILVTGAANYNDYAVVVTITAEDKETVTISGLTAASGLVYNGIPQIGYTGTVTISGNKVSTGELVYTYTGTDSGTYNSTTPPTNAGAYKLVVSVAETNEDFAGEHEAIFFMITKKDIAIPTADTTEFTYSGEEQTYVIVASDAYRVSNNNHTNAGVYPVTVELTDKANTQWAEDKDTNNKTFDFVIQKVSATVTADNKSKIEGEANPVFTFTTNGFVNGESIIGVTFNLTGTTITPEGGTVSGGGNDNYNITYEAGTLTIRPAQEVLAETISAATIAKTGVIASDKTASEVPNGQKFVSTALMTALNMAIADAQQISEADPVLDAITALNNALQAFIDGIQVGTMPISSGGGFAPPIAPVTEIPNGGSTTGSNIDLLISEDKTLTVEADTGAKLVFDTEALKGIVGQTSSDIKVEMKDVSPAHQENLPGKQVFSLTVSSNSSTITNFSGAVTVTLPYTLKDGEAARDVTVWYLSSDGTMTEIPCTYDPAKGLATFKVMHFSLYVVGVNMFWVNPFTDVRESDWFCGAVEFVNRNGLMQGVGGTAFSPNTTVTRSMLVSILWRLENEPAATKTMSFTDITDSKWYAKAVAWAASEEIVTGYDGKFDPNGTLTREQLASILYRYAAYKSYDVSIGDSLSAYADKPSSWAVSSVSWAVAEGLIKGSGSRLDPKSGATRAQSAAILQRFIENIAK